MNASGAVFVGALALLFGSGILASAASVVTTVNSNSPTCVVEIPDSASISSWSNSTMQGSVVTFGNGTEIVFPADACVRPVYSGIYALDLAIESNANFTRAENGSRFAPPASYETCSQFAAQPEGASSVVCPPQGATYALYYQAYSCPGGASNVTLDTDCAPYVLLSFGLFGKTLIMPCSNLVTVDELEALNVYVPYSNGTFDTSSVFVQTDTMPNVYECIETTTSQGNSTAQTSQSFEGSSSTNTILQGAATRQSVSSSQSVKGGQAASFETIGIVVAVVVVTSLTVMTRRRRG